MKGDGLSTVALEERVFAQLRGKGRQSVRTGVRSRDARCADNSIRLDSLCCAYSKAFT